MEMITNWVGMAWENSHLSSFLSMSDETKKAAFKWMFNLPDTFE